MGGSLNKLTAKQIEGSMPLPGGKERVINDGGGLSLTVRLGESGQVIRSWIFRYNLPGSKLSSNGKVYRAQRKMGLGPIETVTAEDAREAARQARLMLLQGIDPIEARKERRLASGPGGGTAKPQKIVTYDAAAEAFVKAWEASWGDNHRRGWMANHKRWVSPKFGDRPVRAITVDDIYAWAHPRWAAEASLMYTCIKQMFQVFRQQRITPNPAQWKGNLDGLLPSLASVHEVENYASMPYAELPDFIQFLRAVADDRDGESSYQRAACKCLEFQILTASRPNEAVGACWSEIDFETATWLIPKERMKGKKGRRRPHYVPLSNQAIELLRSMPRVDGDDRIFPFDWRHPTHALWHLLRGVLGLEHETAHGFRTTFSVYAGEKLPQFDDSLVEHSLAHKAGSSGASPLSMTFPIYSRTTKLDLRRGLMQAWANFACGGKLDPDRVIPKMKRSHCTSPEWKRRDLTMAAEILGLNAVRTIRRSGRESAPETYMLINKKGAVVHGGDGELSLEGAIDLCRRLIVTAAA